MALAVCLRPDQKSEIAVLTEFNGRFLATREGTGLDIGAKPYPTELATFCAFFLPGLEVRPAGDFQRLVEVAGIVSGVIETPGLRGVGQLFRLDEVPLPDFDRAEACLFTRLVHQPFDQISSLRTPCPAKSVGRHGVHVDAFGFRKYRRNVVET